MAVESEAVFKERAYQLGLEPVWAKFEERGWLTYGTFAYASSYTPGSPDDKAFIDNVVLKIVESADNPKTAVLRRLYFESYTVATAELRRKHDRTEEDAPRKIPAKEKEYRRKLLAEKLAPGIEMVGPLDPSFALVDLLCQIHDDNALRYVEWDQCGTRAQDLEPKKKPRKEWGPDASGVVREKEVVEQRAADTSTDLKLQETMQRRGMGFEMSDLMSYVHHDRII